MKSFVVQGGEPKKKARKTSRIGAKQRISKESYQLIINLAYLNLNSFFFPSTFSYGKYDSGDQQTKYQRIKYTRLINNAYRKTRFRRRLIIVELEKNFES